MKLLKKIFDFFFAEEEYEWEPRARIPLNVKLTYPRNVRPKTKNIIESQVSKELDDFNKRVNECKTWLHRQGYWGMHAAFEIYRVIPKLSKKDLLALRVANSEYRTPHPANFYVDKAINDTLKARGYKFVSKAGKR